MLPGLIGGAGWGGGATDPVTRTFYVKAYNDPFLARVEAVEPGAGDADYLPNFDGSLTLKNGLPLLSPPYGTLTAIDLETGEHLWQRPFGDDSAIRTHPALTGLDLPPMGGLPQSHGTTSGPLVTAGGIVFLAGGTPWIEGIDTANGATLWRGDLGGGLGRGNPMTYRTKAGRQFVVVATSAIGQVDSKLQAFALP